jgi:hypothetical protein
MKKVVINCGYNGFGLSEAARKILEESGEIVDCFGGRTGENEIYNYVIERDDPRLVSVVEKLGGIDAKNEGDERHFLKIVEIPDDVEWQIGSYDGNERVEEKHRTWS